MGRDSNESFIIDTSAFISLESIKLFGYVVEYFNIITTLSVIKELYQFAKYDDESGRIARTILNCKDKFILKRSQIEERIGFLEETDNELYNLTLKEDLPLVTDDHKLNHHTRNKITVYFSTFFLITFVFAGVLTKDEAIKKLEMLKDIRKWGNNIIYLTSKKELEQI